jgi:hypothetical protein
MTNESYKIDRRTNLMQPGEAIKTRGNWPSLLVAGPKSCEADWVQVDLATVTQQAIHYQLGPLLHYRLRAAQLAAPPEQDQQLQALARLATVQSLR